MDLEGDIYKWGLILGAVIGAAWGVHIGGIGGLILGIVLGGIAGKIGAWAILITRAWGSLLGFIGLAVILLFGFIYLIDALWGVGRI